MIWTCWAMGLRRVVAGHVSDDRGEDLTGVGIDDGDDRALVGQQVSTGRTGQGLLGVELTVCSAGCSEDCHRSRTGQR